MSRVIALVAFAATAGALPDDPEWDAFKKLYKKNYKDGSDETARYRLFKESQVRVKKLNELNGEPAFGINFMSDRHENEKQKKGLVKPRDFVPTAPVKEWKDAPRSPKGINWAQTEAVTAVKNQGQCGSCWAFSATEAIESQLVLATGGLYRVDLSPQQICSCTPSTGKYGSQGCNGGFTEGAYEYVKSVTGLSNSFFIPYEQSLTNESQTAACPQSKVDQLDGPMETLQGSYAAVSGYTYATPPCTKGSCTHQDLKKFAAALEHTPLSICVNAGTWNDYTGGVLTAAACGPMGAMYQDHCVMATGFNATAPKPYWIVRNSWATTWGDEGYIYLEMAKNTCGLADDATIPTVSIDISELQEGRAAASRERMYRAATMGWEPSTEPIVV